MAEPKQVIIFPNGNIAVFNEAGEQMPELQDGWVDFDYLKKLAKALAGSDDATIEGEEYLPSYYLTEYINFYEKYPDVEA